MRGELLWVYEGLTEYLSDVLMVRSGFRAPVAWRRDLLGRIASMRMGQGREWQSLADVALVAPYTYVHGTGTALRGAAPPLEMSSEISLVFPAASPPAPPGRGGNSAASFSPTDCTAPGLSTK